MNIKKYWAHMMAGVHEHMNSFITDRRAELRGLSLGALISFGLGIYVVAYVVLDAALAVANKTGFSSTLNTLVTTVMPIMIVIGAVWLIYKKAGIQ